MKLWALASRAASSISACRKGIAHQTKQACAAAYCIYARFAILRMSMSTERGAPADAMAPHRYRVLCWDLIISYGA